MTRRNGSKEKKETVVRKKEKDHKWTKGKK
jgi:hypothetical protein